MSVKAKFNLILGMVLLGLISFVVVLNIVISNLKDFSNMDFLSEHFNVKLLELRKNEKDFFLRRDMKYVAEFNEIVKEIHLRIEELGTLLKKHNVNLNKEVEYYLQVLNSYKSAFNDYSLKQKTIGLTPDSGLYGEFRKSIRVIEDNANKNNNFELLSAIYDMRK